MSYNFLLKYKNQTVSIVNQPITSRDDLTDVFQERFKEEEDITEISFYATNQRTGLTRELISLDDQDFYDGCIIEVQTNEKATLKRQLEELQKKVNDLENNGTSKRPRRSGDGDTDKELPPNHRPGDWTCPDPGCAAHNFASKTACFRCNIPKSAPSNFKVGDWMCNSCSQHNFTRNVACFKCKMPKNSGPGGMGMGMGVRPGMDMGMGGPRGHGHGGGGGLLPRPPSGMGMGMGMDMDMGMGMGMGMGGMGGPNVRPGDWTCQSCGGHNFASKTKCFTCQSPKSQRIGGMGMNLPPNFKHGDWMCKCGQHNFSSKMECHRCKTPKEEGNVSGDASHGGDGGSSGSGVMLPPNFRDGDWMCKCGQHNFSSKEECHKCKIPKQEGTLDVSGNSRAPPLGSHSMGFGKNIGGFRGGGLPHNFQSGDWMCICGQHNFTSKVNCHKCKISKAEGDVSNQLEH